MSVSGGSRGFNRDRRLVPAIGTIAIIGLLGLLISMLPGRGVDARAKATAQASADTSPFAGLGNNVSRTTNGSEHEAAQSRAPSGSPELDSRLQRVLAEARLNIDKKRFDKAIAVLESERENLQDNATAYAMIGMALQGRGDPLAARDFYLAAIDRDPMHSESYWGVATTSESLGELDAAVGAMRSYLHTEPDLDPSRLRVNQARSAIWEWESRLGRGPWGPTRGIPPGFSADELRRDGRGVGVKMPSWESVDPEGRMKYEIKHADRIKIYPRP